MSSADVANNRFVSGLRSISMEPKQFCSIYSSIPKNLQNTIYMRSSSKQRYLTRPHSSYKKKSQSNKKLEQTIPFIYDEINLSIEQIQRMINTENAEFRKGRLRTDQQTSNSTFKNISEYLATTINTENDLAESACNFLAQKRLEKEKESKSQLDFFIGEQQKKKYHRHHLINEDSEQQTINRRGSRLSKSLNIQVRNFLDGKNLSNLKIKTITLANNNEDEKVLKGLSTRTSGEIYDEIIISPNYIGQSEVIYQYILQTSNPRQPAYDIQPRVKKIISQLPNQVLAQYKKDKIDWYPQSQLNDRKLAQHIEQIYGKNYLRWLYPSEESLVINTIENLLDQCKNNLEILCHGVQKILQMILQLMCMEELNRYIICMRQIEYHWKIMATIFRCSKFIDFNHRKNYKTTQSAQLRGHFLDMQRKENPLVQFLWKNSKRCEKPAIE